MKVKEFKEILKNAPIGTVISGRLKFTIASLREPEQFNITYRDTSYIYTMLMASNVDDEYEVYYEGKKLEGLDMKGSSYVGPKVLIPRTYRNSIVYKDFIIEKLQKFDPNFLIKSGNFNITKIYYNDVRKNFRLTYGLADAVTVGDLLAKLKSHEFHNIIISNDNDIRHLSVSDFGLSVFDDRCVVLSIGERIGNEV